MIAAEEISLLEKPQSYIIQQIISKFGALRKSYRCFLHKSNISSHSSRNLFQFVKPYTVQNR